MKKLLFTLLLCFPLIAVAQKQVYYKVEFNIKERIFGKYYINSIKKYNPHQVKEFVHMYFDSYNIPVDTSALKANIKRVNRKEFDNQITSFTAFMIK